ncbi:MAG: GDSL-type esterase/lipase family protein [Jatrophihabitantaceae bacterium]
MATRTDPALTRIRAWLTSPIVILIVIALVIAALIGVYRRHRIAVEHAHGQAACRVNLALNASRGDPRPLTTGAPTVAVLGDGLAQGAGLPAPRSQAWPALLGLREEWTTEVNADERSGFINGGFCGKERFARRAAAVAALHPDVVIVEGGTSDVGTTSPQSHKTNIEDSEQAALRQLRSIKTVVVVGPVATGGKPSSDAQALDAALADRTTKDQRIYVSALSWPVQFQPNGMDLTPSSDAIFAADLRAALHADGVGR